MIDAAGRLEAVKISGATVGAYVYNANNQRTQKTASAVVTHYVYGLGGLLYGEYDNTGALIREYVYLNGQPLAQVDSGEVLSYLHTDHLGTPRYATNTSGAQVWNWDSDAFGNGTPSGSATVNLRFAGQYWDDESSLHYNWNRFYDPETGRYISSDPIGLAGGLNTFGYALANPIMYTDPRGLKSKASTIGSSIAAGCSRNSACTRGLADAALDACMCALSGACNMSDYWDNIWNSDKEEKSETKPKPDKKTKPGPVSKDDEQDHPDFVPDKKKKGNRKIPWDKNKKGYKDKDGNYWEPVPDGHKGTHDPHWDVQKPDRSHKPKYPEKITL